MQIGRSGYRHRIRALKIGGRIAHYRKPMYSGGKMPVASAAVRASSVAIARALLSAAGFVTACHGI
jgi:hypothetical protein